VASITANDRGHADAALVRRFRQAQTKRERTGVFADVVRQHREALLCFCAERLWPDADAAVAAAADALIAARLTMADPVRLPRPDRLRGWLLGITAQDCRTPGQPARVEDIDWEAVRARAAADVPEMPDSPASMASLRRWLEQIVGTLPEPRQRMYDLFVTRGLDSLNAALELGTTVAEVRRLRRENRQAILRAFEVMALAAAEAVLSSMGSATAPGCPELGQILADAQQASVPCESGRRFMPVLPASSRLSMARHLSECATCQYRRDDCMARWASELLPILAAAELFEQVMADSQALPERGLPRVAPGGRNRVSSARTARTVVVRRTVAAGAGVLGALSLLAFVWPGLLRGTPSDAASSPQAFSSGPVGVYAPQVAGTGQVATSSHPARSKKAGVLSSAPAATGSSPAPSFPSVPTSVYFTVPPSATPTSSPVQATSGASTASKSAAPSPSASSPKSTKTSPAPSPTKTTPKPSASTSAPAPSATPSASTSTPAPSSTPSATASDPAPTASPSDTTPSSTPTDSASTPAPSASATS
jgi:DNA-directed RNA polymerase specialized sigma24 family protein